MSTRSAAVWALLRTVSRRIISLGLFVALARFVGPTEMGIAALVGTCAALAQTAIGAGISDAIVQRPDLSNDVKSAATGIAIGACLAASLALVFAARPLEHIAGTPEIRAMVYALIASLPLLALSVVPEAIMWRQLEFRRMAVLSLTTLTVSGSIAVWMASQGLGAWSVVAYTILAPGLYAAAIVVQTRAWRMVRPSLEGLRDLRSFVAPNASAQFVNTGIQNVDNLVIGAVLGTSQLGLYTLAYRVPTVLLDVTAVAANSVVYPELSRHKEHHGEHSELAARRLGQISLLGMPAFFGMAALGEDFIVPIFGPEWREAQAYLTALSIFGIAIFIRRFDRSLLLSAARPGIGLALDVLALLGLGLALLTSLFAPEYLPLGIAMQAVLLTPIDLVISARGSRVDSKSLFAALAPSTAAAMTMAFAVYLVRQTIAVPPFQKLFALVASGVFVYVVALTVFAPRTTKSMISRIRVRYTARQ